MSIRLAVLGSGSGGNSTLVEFHGDRALGNPGAGDPGAGTPGVGTPGGQPLRILIDAGFSPRETARRLSTFRIRLEQISDIFITHLDGDHLRPGWRTACSKFRIRMHMCRRHYRRSPMRFDMGDRLQPFDDRSSGMTLRSESVQIEPVPFAHDQLGSTGYVIEHAGERLGFATDLGRVPAQLFEAFRDLDFLAIESNYDRSMQLESARPEFLKRRIMGGAGHLSNRQALDAIHQIAQQSRLRHIVLLHVSRQCNDPGCIEELYAEHAPGLLPHVTIANQFDPTPMLVAADLPVARVDESQISPASEHQTLWSPVG